MRTLLWNNVACVELIQHFSLPLRFATGTMVTPALPRWGRERSAFFNFYLFANR